MRALSPHLRRPAVAPLAVALLLAGLLVALLPGRPVGPVIVLAACGAALALALVVPAGGQLVMRRRELIAVVAVAALVIGWAVVGVRAAERPWLSLVVVTRGGSLLDAITSRAPATSWPWRLDGLPLPGLLIAALCAVGGFVLIADAVRVQRGLARPPRSLWGALTATTPTRGGRIAARALPGFALIGGFTFLAIGLVARLTRTHPILAPFGTLAVVAFALALAAAPVAVGVAMGIDLDPAGRAREQERLRFAAHLHDSVLQTLALIQRQSHDPATVTRLARRQEHALRSWMAGEADLTSATVAVALREMIDEIEEEHAIAVELTAIGDTGLDRRGEELIAAAREALRNAAHHAPGAPVNVFLDVDAARTELFVRDDGPGFDFSAVAAERRGLRDAVIGRMGFAGGSATVESAPGEGTEIALRLPHRGARG